MTGSERKGMRMHNSELQKLRECPFCGGKAFVTEYLYSCDPTFHATMYAVECNGCHTTTFEYASKEEAIEAWNRRAEDA